MPRHPFGGALLFAVAVLLAMPSIARADPAPAASPAASTATAAPAAASPSGAAPDSATLTPEQQAALQAAIIKSSQNPVGNIAVIPFQNNWNYGYGPYQRTQYNLNVQPVVPIQLSPNANLIARVIVPFVNQPSAAPPSLCSASPYGCPYNFGIGDINPQFYFAPKTDPNGLIWGAGAQFLFPTGSAANLTAGKYGAGPAIVGLIMPGNIVTGVLVTQMWSIGGDPTRPNISSLFIQPFFNYNLKGGWAIFFGSSGITANWTAPSGQKWLVPIGTGATKTFKLGDQPMQIGVQYFGNVVRPANTPYGTYRASWSLLFPIKRGAGPTP